MRHEKIDRGQHLLADPLAKIPEPADEATSLAPAEAEPPAFILKHFAYCGRAPRRDVPEG